jgi:hypothetical protein
MPGLKIKSVYTYMYILFYYVSSSDRVLMLMISLLSCEKKIQVLDTLAGECDRTLYYLLQV